MKKLLALVLAMLMALSFAAIAEDDGSEQVNLVIWMMGDKPLDYDVVIAEINKITLEKLNCTVEVNFTGWSDWATAYSLLLTSNDPIDLLYSASWTSDRSYARRGAFMELDGLVEDSAPELWEMIPSYAWDYATIDGYIYCIPTPFTTYSGGGIIYRKDLCEKYNLPAPDSLENALAFMQGIKENCPEMYVNLDGGAASNAIILLDYFRYSLDTDAGIIIGDTTVENAANASYLDVKNYYSRDCEHFMESLRFSKTCADAGYWDRNLEANPNQDVNGFFEQGLVALTYNGENIDKWSGIYSRVAENHPDWKVDFIPFSSLSGYSEISSPIQDSTVIPITSEHPERALQFIQLVYTDQELQRLFAYGIEGVHYLISEDGGYANTDKSSDYGQYAMNTWAWKTEEFMLASASELSYIRDDKIAYMDTLTPLPPSKFSFDKTSVETEIAALSQVVDQYLSPLQYGLTDNLDADVDIFLAKAEEAGLSKIQAEYLKQYQAYCEENDIK